MQQERIYPVKEEGRNGTVEIQGHRIVRTLRKLLGRDDAQTIPVSNVSHVELDRRTLGSDIVTVHVGRHTYQWKTRQAEELHDRILDLIDTRPVA